MRNLIFRRHEQRCNEFLLAVIFFIAARNGVPIIPWHFEGGRDVAKRNFVLLPVVLAFALAGTSMLGQAPGGQEPDFKNAYSGGPLTCSQQQPHTIYVPRPIAERARLKARLLNLLRDSLFDDAKGVVNMARESEIKKLASKLKSSTPE
jgi:hypothetical protein